VATPPGDDQLAPDEPPTPAWLPVLGVALVVLALIWFVAF
jgi:hypothetical protein